MVNAAVRARFEAEWGERAPGLPVQVTDGRAREVLAAADVVLVASGTATLETLLSKVSTTGVRLVADGPIGSDLVAVRMDKMPMDAFMKRLADAVGFTMDEIAASPFVLYGNPAQLADDLRARREQWGFSYIIVGAGDVDAFAPVVAELAGN